MIYKISSWFFAGLAMLSTAMFFITHNLAGKTLSATVKRENKGAKADITGDILPNTFAKFTGIFLPMWIFCKIKAHFKAIKRERKRKRNKLFLAVTLLLMVLSFLKKK